MHKCDQVGSSAMREITRSKDDAIVSILPQGKDLMNELRIMVKYFESNAACRKNMI